MIYLKDYQERNVTILGVRYFEMNYNFPSNVTIEYGDIGDRVIVMKITSPPEQGISGLISFCYKRHKSNVATTEPTNIENFFETNVNINHFN